MYKRRDKYKIFDNDIDEVIGILDVDRLAFDYNWDYKGDKCPEALSPDKTLGSSITCEAVVQFLKEEFDAKDIVDALCKIQDGYSGKTVDISYIPITKEVMTFEQLISGT